MPNREKICQQCQQTIQPPRALKPRIQFCAACAESRKREKQARFRARSTQYATEPAEAEAVDSRARDLLARIGKPRPSIDRYIHG